MALNTIGRGEEAGEHVRRASELDPLSPAVNVTQAAYLFETDPAAARARLSSVLELEPDYWAALVERSRWATVQRRPREAIADLQRAADHSHRNAMVLASLAKAHLAVGERDHAHSLLGELHARRRDGYVPASALAMMHVALGNTGSALDELERGYAERDVRMAYFTASGSLELLHGQPRFIALARRVGTEGERALVRR